MRRLALLSSLLLVAGCATPARNRLVWISLGGSGPCTVEMDKRRFTLPAEEQSLSAEASRIAATRAGALVSGAADLSFPCYRIAMAVLDRARFRRVGFVSDIVSED